jgi:hypothetical protein
MTWGPIFARTVMEKHEPLFSILIGEAICLAGAIIGTYTGLHSVAGPVIQAVCINIGLQNELDRKSDRDFGVEPKARSRINTAYMVSVFCGQLTGTTAGNHLYTQGGWIKSGSASVGFVSSALVICLMRRPHEQGWIGWGGGYKMRKASFVIQPQADQEMGAAGKHIPQPSETIQTHTESKQDDIDGVVGLKTSGHSSSGGISEKTLTNLEDNPSKLNREEKAGNNLK